MGRIIFKQPNGKVGIWSTIVDSPIAWNLTKEGYIHFLVEEFREKIEEEAEDIFSEEPKRHWVVSLEDLAKHTIYNMEKEEFDEFLKECESDLTHKDFTFVGDGE